MRGPFKRTETDGTTIDRTHDCKLNYLILVWYRRARTAQLAHSKAATRARRQFLWLGIPAAFLSVMAGSASISDIGFPKWMVATSAFGAATLISFQNLLRLDESSTQHAKCSRGFGRIRRSLGQLAASPNPGVKEIQSRLDEIKAHYDEIAADGPQVAARIWQRQKKVDEFYWPAEFGSRPQF